MHQIARITRQIHRYFINDYCENAPRMIAECLGTSIAIWVAILLAITTPNPPMLTCYIGWNIGSILLVLCAWSRGSVGLTILYASFLIIDSVGLMRTILN